MIKLFEKKAQDIFNIGTGKGIGIKSFVKKLTKKIVVVDIKKINLVIL